MSVHLTKCDSEGFLRSSVDAVQWMGLMMMWNGSKEDREC